MKIRINYTVNVDDYFRNALSNYYGEKSLATRKDIQHWYEENGKSADADLLTQYDDALAKVKECK